MPSKSHLQQSGLTTFVLVVVVSVTIALVPGIPDLNNKQSAMASPLSVNTRRVLIAFILFVEFVFGVVRDCCWTQAPTCAKDISWMD